jgi:hypothetical protein
MGTQKKVNDINSLNLDLGELRSRRGVRQKKNLLGAGNVNDLRKSQTFA